MVSAGGTTAAGPATPWRTIVEGLPAFQVAEVGTRLPGIAPVARPLADLEAQLPEIRGPVFSPTSRLYKGRERPDGPENKLTVGLLSGCVMPLLQGSTMEAAVRVLTRNGCDVSYRKGRGAAAR